MKRAWVFRARDALIVLDQLRTVDKERLVKSLGSIDEGAQGQVSSLLQEMFVR